jgi:hypothetical protein
MLALPTKKMTRFLSEVQVKLAARSTSASHGQKVLTASKKRMRLALTQRLFQVYLCGKWPGPMSGAARVPSLRLGLPTLLQMMGALKDI